MTKQTNSAIGSLCFKMLHRFYNSFISTKKLQASSRQCGRFLPICAKDTPHFWSEVYKVGTRARKVQVDLVQGGRSMIEMLGVLAIIGVLSVGGIVGYTKAMSTYKINNTLNNYNHIITTILQQGHKAWKLTSGADITSDMLDAVGIFPDNWTVARYNYFYDDLNNTVRLMSYAGVTTGEANNGFLILVINEVVEEGNDTDPKYYEIFCRDFISKFLKSHANEIDSLTDYNYSSYYGNSSSKCQSDPSICIRNITPVMAQKLCRYSNWTNSTPRPRFSIIFKFAF